jgi:hypothetical protein
MTTADIIIRRSGYNYLKIFGGFFAKFQTHNVNNNLWNSLVTILVVTVMKKFI